MGYTTEDDAFVNSIVGEGTHFKGHLELAGLLRIDGDFSGSIKTAGKVLIGKNGRADCTVEAATVVVGGAVRGTIYCSEKVIVLSSAVILGNVYAPRMVAEEGVILDGTFMIRGESIDSVAETPEEKIKKRPLWFRSGRNEEEPAPPPERRPARSAASREDAGEYHRSSEG